MAELDDMLKMLPAIAEAVNAFKSESVQERAFEALLETMRGKSLSPGHVPLGPAESGATNGGRKRPKRSSAADGSTTGDTAKGQRSRRQGGGRLSIVGDLNLRPTGKQSFSDFAALKSPRSAPDMIAVAVFYLRHTAGVDKVATNHIYTCFKDVGWRLPANLPNTVSVAASRHSLLHTGGLTDITLTSRGENLVEHDLPAAKK
jgi:hypothetical protein